jgi:hypothetical protein
MSAVPAIKRLLKQEVRFTAKSSWAVEQVLFGKIRQAKLEPHCAKDLIILGQRFHLMPETAVPQRLQTSVLCEDAVFDARSVFLAKPEFFRNGSDQMGDFDACMRGEEP